jgi:hypothetical protein
MGIVTRKRKTKALYQVYFSHIDPSYKRVSLVFPAKRLKDLVVHAIEQGLYEEWVQDTLKKEGIEFTIKEIQQEFFNQEDSMESCFPVEHESSKRKETYSAWN